MRPKASVALKADFSIFFNKNVFSFRNMSFSIISAQQLLFKNYTQRTAAEPLVLYNEVGISMSDEHLRMIAGMQNS